VQAGRDRAGAGEGQTDAGGPRHPDAAPEAGRLDAPPHRQVRGLRRARGRRARVRAEVDLDAAEAGDVLGAGGGRTGAGGLVSRRRAGERGGDTARGRRRAASGRARPDIRGEVLRDMSENAAREVTAVEPYQPQTTAVTPMDLLDRAMQRGMDAEALGKLLDLQQRWEADQARKAFVQAMAAFKAEPLKIDKKKAVEHNGKYMYSHATLAQVVDAVVGA